MFFVFSSPNVKFESLSLKYVQGSRIVPICVLATICIPKAIGLHAQFANEFIDSIVNINGGGYIYPSIRNGIFNLL
jgi:hypothetical protein